MNGTRLRDPPATTRGGGINDAGVGAQDQFLEEPWNIHNFGSKGYVKALSEPAGLL